MLFGKTLKKIFLQSGKGRILKQGHFQKYKKEALEKIRSRVDFFAQKHSFSFNKISVKNNKSLWGSCSSKKNLNFNYKLIFLKKELMDYVVVHELCHLKQMNHSKLFWREVEKILPNYKLLRKELKEHNPNFFIF